MRSDLAFRLMQRMPMILGNFLQSPTKRYEDTCYFGCRLSPNVAMDGLHPL
jgi:hypothetical protein